METKKPRQMPRVVVVLLLLTPGCSHNPSESELAKVYRTGMTRDEAASTLGKVMAVQTRPAEGWQQQEQSAGRIGAFAALFEKEHNTKVQTCEVYSVPRGFMGMGVWWDYLFYGEDDRLLGFRRRIID